MTQPQQSSGLRLWTAMVEVAIVLVVQNLTAVAESEQRRPV